MTTENTFNCWRDGPDLFPFEALLVELSASFINLPAGEVDAAIQEAQKRICDGLGIEICTLWQLCGEMPGTMYMTHYHAPPGFPELPRVMDAQELSPWCLEKMHNRENVVLSRVSDAPVAAARDRALWEHYGVKSVLTLPIAIGGEPVIGALNFNALTQERDWSDALISRLQLVAQIFSNALARKRTEQALMASEARYRGIFDNAVEGMFRTSVQGCGMMANPALAAMLGYGSGEELTREVQDTARQVWAIEEERARYIQQLEKEERIHSWECQFKRKDGTPIWVSLSSRAARARDGAIVHFEGFVVDITERKRLELELQNSLEEVKRLRDQLLLDNSYLREQIRRDDGQDVLVGESASIVRMLSKAKQVAPTDATVLITGETGTGKELLAQAIHAMSLRKARVMITVNCAALPAPLIEGELFGREKGAYTGAMTQQTGRFEVADGSTIFLDEIGDLPLDLQVKLLRVLEDGRFERLGSHRTLRSNVRVIAATNRNLVAMVREGTFREDLFHRLNVFPIEIPPLRARIDDIPALVWKFVRELNVKMGKSIEAIPKQAMEQLQQYRWPGNVRELRNLIERAVIVSEGRTLKVIIPDLGQGAAPVPVTLEQAERAHILAALESTRWRISGKGGAAERLGLIPTTLQSRLKKLGIVRPKT